MNDRRAYNLVYKDIQAWRQLNERIRNAQVQDDFRPQVQNNENRVMTRTGSNSADRRQAQRDRRALNQLQDNRPDSSHGSSTGVQQPALHKNDSRNRFFTAQKNAHQNFAARPKSRSNQESPARLQTSFSQADSRPVQPLSNTVV